MSKKEEKMWEELKPYKCPNCASIKSMTCSEASEEPQVECQNCHCAFAVRA